MQLFINTCLFASANCFGSLLAENPPSESLFPPFGKVNNARSGCLDRLLWPHSTEHGKTSPTIARLMQSLNAINGRWCHIRWCDRNHRRYDVSIVIYLWYHLRDKEEEDRSRDGWTVSTGTWELSRQQKTKSMTELAGGELCLPQRPHH